LIALRTPSFGRSNLSRNPSRRCSPTLGTRVPSRPRRGQAVLGRDGPRPRARRNACRCYTRVLSEGTVTLRHFGLEETDQGPAYRREWQFDFPGDAPLLITGRVMPRGYWRGRAARRCGAVRAEPCGLPRSAAPRLSDSLGARPVLLPTRRGFYRQGSSAAVTPMSAKAVKA
jgi:hypothetical protein